jgi:hypothetical protein
VHWRTSLQQYIQVAWTPAYLQAALELALHASLHALLFAYVLFRREY